ncbi:MAG: RDD family protein [Clostridia bacterium]|nr:RDD family protein [Clostridia bacterium]
MNKRILAFLVDYFASMIILALVGLFSFLNITNRFWSQLYGILLFFCVFIICFKDIFAGQSFGKRIMKLKVVSLENKQPNVLVLLIRNITLLVWPIEVLLVLLDKPRIGDVIAKTKVVTR